MSSPSRCYKLWARFLENKNLKRKAGKLLAKRRKETSQATHFDGIRQAGRLDRRLHVVNADDVGAMENGGGDGGHGRVKTFFRGHRVTVLIAKYSPEERFSRGAD